MISIITTMYNAEKTISKMIESVLAQTYQDFELIIVDDCSNDISREIINGYIDNRIKYVKLNENMGPGNARNMGITLSRGEYITFLDSDDYLATNALEKLVESDDFDVVICGYFQEYNDYTIDVIPKETDINPALLDAHKLFSFCWNKLYKAEIIKGNSICFPEIMHSEDFFFNVEYFKYVSTISIVPIALYHYVKPNQLTLTTNDYIDGFFDLITKRNEAMLVLCQDDAYQYLVANVHLKHVLSSLINICSNKSSMNFIERRKFISKSINDPLVVNALNNCRADSKSSFIINAVLCTKNVTFIQVFVYVTYFIKTKLQFIFDRIK